MDDSLITLEQNKIIEFRKRIKEISLKPRTINNQFKNRFVINNAQRRMIVKRDKSKLNSKIACSEATLKSLLGGI